MWIKKNEIIRKNRIVLVSILFFILFTVLTFTLFASASAQPPIPTPPLPPIFTDLNITPAEIEPGNEVTISFTITNSDNQTLVYTVTMQIGELNLLIDVELGAYESKTVSRTITQYILGDYNVTVDSLKGTFTVKSPEIIVPPLPPILSDLMITPKEIELGDEVTIGLDVMNIDSQSFTYIVTMQIGELTLLIDVELEPYESKTVNRIITPDMVGDFNVTVDGLTGSFTVKTPPKPAEFEFSNLRIFFPGVIPPEVERDQTVTVTVSIDVTNVGEEMGGCTVELKVNGEVFDSEEIPPFGGGVTATQLFELTMGEGTYEVEVDGLTDSFTVNPKLSFWDKIPGFPYESIIFGLVTGTFVLWMLSRRIMTL